MQLQTIQTQGNGWSISFTKNLQAFIVFIVTCLHCFTIIAGKITNKKHYPPSPSQKKKWKKKQNNSTSTWTPLFFRSPVPSHQIHNFPICSCPWMSQRLVSAEFGYHPLLGTLGDVRRKIQLAMASAQPRLGTRPVPRGLEGRWNTWRINPVSK